MFTLSYFPIFLSKYTNLLLIISNYSVITTISFLLFSSFQLINLANSSSNANKLSVLILFNLFFFLNLAGIPPFPGFFIKLNLLVSLLKYINIYLIIILIIINFTIFYFYIQFYKNIEVYAKTKKFNNSRLALSLSVIAVYILINFYPIYNLGLLFI